MRVLKSLLFSFALSRFAVGAGHARGKLVSVSRQSPVDGVSQSNVPTTLKQLWTYEAGESIESSAAIVGGTVFVGSQKGELVALSLENGSVYWKFPTGIPIGESSPAYGGGVVYIGDLGGWLNAINASDGKKLWAFKANGEIKSSPVVVGDRVLIGSYDETPLLSLDAQRFGAVEVQDERTGALDARYLRRNGFHRRLRRNVSRDSHCGWQRSLQRFFRSIHRRVAGFARGFCVLRHV